MNTFTRLAVQGAVALGVAIGTPVAIGALPVTAPMALADECQWVNVTGSAEAPEWTQHSDKSVWKCYGCGTVCQGVSPVSLDSDD